MPTFPIYLDNNATTRTDPRVVEAMLPYFSDIYGNAASRSHSFGWAAEQAVGKARAQVARLIGADPREIVWTSGATEADNLALKGVMEKFAPSESHLITVVTEHAAILDSARHLEQCGYPVTYLEVDCEGRLSLGELRAAITPQTKMVSVMMGNNEIGTLQPVAEIGAICREHEVLFHSDATQCIGKIPVSMETLPIDLMSLTAHKMHGPKGVGALYVRRRAPRVRLTPQMDGGGHEHGMRSGTLNVPGIVGFGKAAEISLSELDAKHSHLNSLRDRLIKGILESIEGTKLNGSRAERLPDNANISFHGIAADAILAAMPEVALSTGSACSSESVSASHVLTAIGLGKEAHSSVRFGVSHYTTSEEIDWVVAKLKEVTLRLRRLSTR